MSKMPKIGPAKKIYNFPENEKIESQARNQKWPYIFYLLLYPTLCVLCVLCGEISTAQNLGEIIRDIDEKQRQIQTFSATFTQKKETSLAREPLFSSGRVHFKRPDQIHWFYLKPERVEVALEENTFWIYLPDRSQADKVSLSRKARGVQTLGALTAVFKKTFNELTEGYTVHLEGLGEERLYHFRLQPKEEKVQKVLSRIDLWIDKSSGAILRFIMVEANGDRLTLEFGDPQINPPLTDDQLKIRIPPSVRVREQSLP